MGYFPFFMDIAGKNGIIVGGGKVAARKAEKLLDFGPKLTVIAPRIEEYIREQGAASLVLQEREFCMEDLCGADFVIAATDDEVLNGRISDFCRESHILVNVVDDREKCTFFFPALVREGDLTVGISTDGRCPAAAAWVRKEISRMLPERLGEVVDLVGQIRPWVMELDVPEETRKAIMEKMFQLALQCME